MAKFVFRLEPLLTARRHAEQGARRVVAVLERERIGLENDLRRHQQQIISDKQQIRGSMTGSLDMQSLRQSAGITLHAIRKAQQLVLQLAGVSQRRESARAGLRKTMTRRRANEVLREKRFGQWRSDQNKAAKAALDGWGMGGAERQTHAPQNT